MYPLLVTLSAQALNYDNKLVLLGFYLQAHPWFDGVDWERIFQMEAAFIPEVKDELDTQNFEKFDEVHRYISYSCFLYSLSFDV